MNCIAKLSQLCLLGLALTRSCLIGQAPALAAEPPASLTWTLRADVGVDGQGIFLPQLVMVTPPQPLPNMRLGEAPAPGQVTLITPAQLLQAVHAAAPELIPAKWSGADQVRVHRLIRTLTESDLRELLAASLQLDHVGQRGELELRLMRPWTALRIPDDPLQIRWVELPNSGVTAYFIPRFELLCGGHPLGSWQMPLQAQIWKEIWVARSPLARGQNMLDADVIKERRDVLGLREPLAELGELEAGWEIAQNVAAGLPLLQRHVRPRPVVYRGQVVDAQLRDGPLLISMKVEVLENGAPGESVRVRNPKTRHEFKGKVSHDQRIDVTL